MFISMFLSMWLLFDCKLCKKMKGCPGRPMLHGILSHAQMRLAFLLFGYGLELHRRAAGWLERIKRIGLDKPVL